MKRRVYTVFFDTGELLGVKDADDETMYVGACVSFGDGWFRKHLASKVFLDFTEAWLANFAPVEIDDRNIDTFDWDTAHQQGLEVARRLKAELVDKADVRYVKPSKDPTRNMEDGCEILSDGTVKSIKRLWWCPL